MTNEHLKAEKLTSPFINWAAIRPRKRPQNYFVVCISHLLSSCCATSTTDYSNNATKYYFTFKKGSQDTSRDTTTTTLKSLKKLSTRVALFSYPRMSIIIIIIFSQSGIEHVYDHSSTEQRLVTFILLLVSLIARKVFQQLFWWSAEQERNPRAKIRFGTDTHFSSALIIPTITISLTFPIHCTITTDLSLIALKQKHSLHFHFYVDFNRSLISTGILAFRFRIIRRKAGNIKLLLYLVKICRCTWPLLLTIYNAFLSKALRIK